MEGDPMAKHWTGQLDVPAAGGRGRKGNGDGGGDCFAGGGARRREVGLRLR